MCINRFRRWRLSLGLLTTVNIIAGLLILSMFTTGSVFGSLIPPLILIFLAWSVAFFTVLFAFAAPPVSILRSVVFSLLFSIAMPFLAMLSASFYVASEEADHLFAAVFRSLLVMSPMLTISAAPLIFPLFVINFAIFEGVRLSFKRRSVQSRDAKSPDA